jgi:hypothetical protein
MLIILSALIANSRRNSSDFETEWPTWTVPKNNDGNIVQSSSKEENGHSGVTSLQIPGNKKQDNVSFSSTFSPNKSKSALKPTPKAKQIKSKTTESTQSLYRAASNAASALLLTQESPILSIQGSSDTNDSIMSAKAAAKAQRKQIKKAEKERRKLEKKKRKILEKQQQQMKEVCSYAN